MTFRTVGSTVSMEPPCALEEQVYRSDIGEERVEIYVQALFDNLGGDEYLKSRA